MRTFKQHREIVRRAMNVHNATARLQDIIDATNESATTIAGMFPIGQLQRKMTVSPGGYLPANLAGIVLVRDSSDGKRVYRRGEAAVKEDEEFKRFYLETGRAPFSAIGLPFKGTGNITAWTSKLTCNAMFSLGTGAFIYRKKIGPTVFHADIDAEGNYVLDAEGNLILRPVDTTGFTPQLSGVRFYRSGATNAGEDVSYDENEALAYWKDETLGWIVTLIGDVGGTPSGYFSMAGVTGEGVGEWFGYFISLEDTQESSIETLTNDDFEDFTVCITNPVHGDFYYKISSVNPDFTFNLDGTHPFDEAGSTVTILRENFQRIRFVDDGESEITSGTFDVFYWIYPNPLTQDLDVIPFAHPDLLELLTIRRLPETKDRRPVSKAEIEDAVNLARKLEPVQTPPPRPQSQQGGFFRLGASDESAYTIRGSR